MRQATTEVIDSLLDQEDYLTLSQIITAYSLPINSKLLGQIGKEVLAKYRGLYQENPLTKPVTVNVGRNAGATYNCHIYPQHFHKYILQIGEQYAG